MLALHYAGYTVPGILVIGYRVRDRALWAYFVVHEVIIHQRFKFFTRSNNTYIRSIRWAHKMHHKHLDKEEGESFGMLFVAKKYWNKVKADNKKHIKKFR